MTSLIIEARVFYANETTFPVYQNASIVSNLNIQPCSKQTLRVYKIFRASCEPERADKFRGEMKLSHKIYPFISLMETLNLRVE